MGILCQTWLSVTGLTAITASTSALAQCTRNPATINELKPFTPKSQIECGTMLFNLSPLAILRENVRCHLFSRLFDQTTRNAIPDGGLCRRLSIGTCRAQLCCRCTRPVHKVVPFQTSKPCTANLLPSHYRSHKTPTLRNSLRSWPV